MRGRTGGSCEFGGWPRVAYFPRFFFDACFAVYNARRLLGSKTWISATSHRQGPRMVSEARNVCFGITGARNRPIPTLLPSETCTQTPLDRPKMLFRRGPDFADAPETAQNGGFRHHFATARFFANVSLSARRPRPKASFARKYRLRNVAALACCFPPKGTFLALKRSLMGNSAYVLSSPQKSFYIQKRTERTIFCSGQLEPIWRGAVAGGVLTYTYIGGYGFESRYARGFFFVGFWCFGAQVAARAKRRVVRGRTGASCEFGGRPRIACFPRFLPMRMFCGL